MRVALICPYSLSRPGGVQGQVEGLARSLARLGHDAMVVAPDDEAPLGIHNGTFVAGRSTAIPANGSVAPVCLSPLGARRARQFVHEGAYDIVHLHEPLAPVTGYGCLWVHERPLVATFHRAGEGVAYRLLGPLARWADARLDARCAVSEAARRTARAVSGSEVELLFNGIELDRFASVPPWPTERPVILFLGRHEERKGLEVLLDAFSRVGRDAVLWIGSDGPQTEALRARFPSSSRVDWLGVVGEDEKLRRLSAADILCAPSLYGESFGVTLLEGMAAGCAVVASDIEGYRSAAGGHARLVPPGDVPALASTLTDALDDASRAQGFSSSEALATARSHAEGWSMDALADRYLEVYERARQSFASRGGGSVARRE